MRYLAAAILLTLGGKPVDEANLKAVLTAGGVKVDDAKLSALVGKLKGKDVLKLAKEGLSQASTTAPVAEVKVEKKEAPKKEAPKPKEPEPVDDDGPLDLFF